MLRVRSVNSIWSVPCLSCHTCLIQVWIIMKWILQLSPILSLTMWQRSQCDEIKFKRNANDFKKVILLLYFYINSQELVLYLLSSGMISANVQDNAGQTPLHISCSLGHLTVTKLLLAFGALPNCKTVDGNRCSFLLYWFWLLSVRSLIASILGSAVFLKLRKRQDATRDRQ